MVRLHSDIVAILASGSIGSILSVLVTGWLNWNKFKTETKRQNEQDQLNDIDFYRQKWRDDEDEIDKLRDQIRDLEDELYKRGK